MMTRRGFLGRVAAALAGAALVAHSALGEIVSVPACVKEVAPLEWFLVEERIGRNNGYMQTHWIIRRWCTETEIRQLGFTPDDFSTGPAPQYGSVVLQNTGGGAGLTETMLVQDSWIEY